MGVTTGELAGNKSQIITITIPNMAQLDQAAADRLSEAINKVIDDFNDMLSSQLEVL
jgi:hypothetical protein